MRKLIYVRRYTPSPHPSAAMIAAASTLAVDGGIPSLAGPVKVARRVDGAASARGDAGSDAGRGMLRREARTDRPAYAASQLEHRWRQVTGQNHAVACPSGAAAAQLGLASLELGPGDEVVCPAGAFFSTIDAISGAVPVHVDLNPQTLHIDPAAVEAAITHRTGAIVALDLYGTPANYGALCAVADRHSLPVLEDASHAHGATLDQRPVGSLGTASFGALPGPDLGSGAGAGGALCTDDDDLAASARLIVLDDQFGRAAGEPEPGDARPRSGGAYHLGDPDAASASRGLGRLDEETAARSANGNHLRRLLRDVAGIALPEAVPGATHVYAAFPLAVQPDELGMRDDWTPALRDTVQVCLEAEGLRVERWRPELIGGSPPAGDRSHQRRVERPVEIADHPVADAARASVLLLGRCDPSFGSSGSPRAMDQIADCVHKVVVENRDRLCQLTRERMVTLATI